MNSFPAFGCGAFLYRAMGSDSAIMGSAATQSIGAPFDLVYSTVCAYVIANGNSPAVINC
jgi:hypothetical protein